ncbi:MAG: PEGA domain-containing protein [Myxococcales bacterium]|nr:PEGA domain-containing protein [Myxococcales bacterium]MCB9545684.1 PEGA domain-containing protein [Myxococcales bacterium]
MARPVVILFVALFWAAPVLGQADPATERARQLFVQGNEHLKAGRFGRAVDAFEQANAIKPHPVMLKNIALTYEAMEDLERAITYYRQYLDAKPKDAGEVKTTVARLEGVMADWPRITVTTDPPGAGVWVTTTEHRSRGTTPLTMVVAPGARKLHIVLAGHEPVVRDVRVNTGQALSLPTITLKRQLPYVSLRTDPAGANVFIDDADEPVGKTPLLWPLPAGEHRVRLVLEGYAPRTETIAVQASHTREAPRVVEAALEKARATGELQVVVNVPAEIRLDGRPIGRAPLPGPVPVEVGLHALEVRPDGGDVYREMVTIEAGRLTETSIDLDAGPGFSLDQRTVSYVVMGVGGAVILGGVVTSILAVGADGDLADCRSDATCNHTDRELTLADDVRSQALTTDILLGVGAAVAATGVVLYLIDESPDARADTGVPRVGLSPTPGGAMAVGSFEF